MSLFIISKRPGETEWSYRNRFSAENAEVNGQSDRRRNEAYIRLRRALERQIGRWQTTEPDTEFRIIDSGIGEQDIFNRVAGKALGSTIHQRVQPEAGNA